MNLIPRSSLFDLDRFFANTLMPFQAQDSTSAFSPRVDITERDNKYEFSAELPGVTKDDVKITLKDGVLTIDAETKQEEKEERDGRVVRQERRYGKFVRSFDLGGDIKEDDINAHFENGILTVTTPKSNGREAEAKRIEIQ